MEVHGKRIQMMQRKICGKQLCVYCCIDLQKKIVLLDMATRDFVCYFQFNLWLIGVLLCMSCAWHLNEKIIKIRNMSVKAPEYKEHTGVSCVRNIEFLLFFYYYPIHIALLLT